MNRRDVICGAGMPGLGSLPGLARATDGKPLKIGC